MASAVENDHELQKPSQPVNAESHPPVATDVTGMPPNLGEAGSDGLPQPEAPLPARFQANPGAGDWSTDLCDCFDDVPNCCLTFWCPCIAFGQLSEIVDRGTSSCALNGMLYFLIAYLVGCPCLYSCFYRSKLRQQYQLSERPCNDCLVHFFCESCSLCQEYRELKHRGFKVSLGWHANAEKHNGGITMAPIVPEHMSR